jgi:hypothetical protein
MGLSVDDWRQGWFCADMIGEISNLVCRSLSR